MKRRSPIHAYKRLLAKDYDWDYAYLIALEKKNSKGCTTVLNVRTIW